MIRTVTESEIANVACPLWALVGHSGAPGQFSLVRSAACAIVAHLAYCAIGAAERERRNRAKIVPCRVHQTLIQEADFDLPAILDRRADFQGVEIVRTARFVAILIPVRKDRLFVGIRGTQFAYDWLINANIAKSMDEISGDYFHVGFMREAQELLEALSNHLGRHSNRSIFLAGHSLGGAVAALINQWHYFDGCYTFGSPRIGNASRLGLRYEPFAMRRHLDIVPHCPPRAFRYEDFSTQLTPDGSPFGSDKEGELYPFVLWLLKLSLGQFVHQHAIERYRLELMTAVRQDSGLDSQLFRCPDVAP